MSDKNIHQKINVSFPASITTGELSLDDKTNDYVNVCLVHSSHEVTQLGYYSR